MGVKFWANLILCVVIGVLFVFGITTMSSALTPKGLFVTDPQPPAEIAGLMDKVRLLDYRLSENGQRMVQAGFVLRNDSDQDVKNFTVQCEFYDSAGNFLDRKQWLLSDRVPAGKTLTRTTVDRRFVHTRAAGLQCRLTGFELDTPPAFVLHRVEGGHGGGHGEAAAGHGGHEVSTHH